MKIKKIARAEIARRSFWDYCKYMAPDYYREERHYLKNVCQVLQALYQGRIVKDSLDAEWVVLPLGEKPIAGQLICKKLMLNMPPQHGKTRTLVLFNSWIFGQNHLEKVITGSYNDTVASDFSRYTRDRISERPVNDEEMVYSDIFPGTRIKQGNAGFEKWALEGSHFSYLGTGVGGSVTSKGASVLIIDDPVKSAEDALNINNLDRIWLWYTSTFLSRVSADQGEPIEIICMTRWSKLDICGRIEDTAEIKEWYRICMKAYDEVTDTMLCDSMLSKKRFNDLRLKMHPVIFNANYQQQAMELEGRLFKTGDLKRFKMSDIDRELNKDKEWLKQDPAVLAYTDVADEGDDYLAMPISKIWPQRVYITEVIFTQDNIDITMPMVVEAMKRNLVKYNRVESNSQGAGFIRDLRKEVGVAKVLKVNNTAQKHTRILLEYGFIKEYCYFLDPSEYLPGSPYDKFMNQLQSYMKDGSSKQHDDAPDSMSGLSKFIQGFLPHLFT